MPHSFLLNRSALLTLKNPTYRKSVADFFAWQVDQDGKDLTTNFVLGKSRKNAIANIVAKAPGILAGCAELDFFLTNYGPELHWEWKKKEGTAFRKKEILLTLRGNAATILRLERILLNTLSRLSGIATLTKTLVEKLPALVFLAATRKTLWGLLDKKAVSVGGGLTHRLGLFDAVLVKENHLALLPQSIQTVMTKIVEMKTSDQGKIGAFWEIEVETPEQLKKAVEILLKTPPAFPGVIMLDNFSPAILRKNIAPLLLKKLHKLDVYLEASGGITPKNISLYAGSGVDILSSGFLTHTAPAIDLSLKLIPATVN